jgi:hypothetical protein
MDRLGLLFPRLGGCISDGSHQNRRTGSSSHGPVRESLRSLVADASPALLEAGVLLLAATLLAIAGVALIFLLGGRSHPKPTEAQRARRRRLAARAFVASVALPLSATGAAVLLVLWAQPALGSRSEVLLALVAGSAGGILAGLLGALAAAGPAVAVDPLDTETARHARQRDLGREVAIATGSAGIALAVFMGLYLAEAGHSPPMAAAALGAVLAAFGARAASPWSAGGEAPPEDLTAERAVGLGAATAARSYALLEAALVAAVLLAYVPSVVRFLEPNAILYPAVALGVVSVATLVGLATALIAPAGNSWVRSHVPLVAATAFSTVGLLAADSAFFYGNLGLWLSSLSGLVGAFVLVEAMGWFGDRPDQGIRPPKLWAVGPAVSVWLLVAVIAVAFALANWTPGTGSWTIDPYLGYYGVALAGVSMAGMAVALHPLRTAAQPIDPVDLDVDGPGARRLARGLDATHLVAATLSALTLVGAALFLDPLEYGATPTELLGRFGWTDPSFLLGLLLGATVPFLLLVATSHSPEGAAIGPAGHRRGPAFRDLIALWLGAIAVPVAVVIVFGPAAMVGSVYATAIVSLAWAVGGERESSADTTFHDRRVALELLILGGALSGLVVGGVWFAQSVVGSL